MTDREEQLEQALQRIVSWSEAYPLAVFPEPDFKKAAELLTAGGMTLDAISASNMRHVVEGVGKIAREALNRETDAQGTDTREQGAEPVARFFIDHGMIHDRVTGKHVTTDGKPPFEDSIEQVCELLNSLAHPPRPTDAGREELALIETATFLLARLEECDFQSERDFHGHVAPAIARLRTALSSAEALSK